METITRIKLYQRCHNLNFFYKVEKYSQKTKSTFYFSFQKQNFSSWTLSTTNKKKIIRNLFKPRLKQKKKLSSFKPKNKSSNEELTMSTQEKIREFKERASTAREAFKVTYFRVAHIFTTTRVRPPHHG